MSILLVNANAVNIPLANESVQCVVTSPPYYGLRDYGTAAWIGGDTECNHEPNKTSPKSTLEGGKSTQGAAKFYRETCILCGARRVDNQIGLEETPEQYVSKLVAVFREVWRVLKDDGILWLNLGDSYAGSGGAGGDYNEGGIKEGQPRYKSNFEINRVKDRKTNKWSYPQKYAGNSIKPKDLLGIPWLVAFALRGDGWYLRSDIIWHKPNPMPESVTDRPTKSHEYIFLLSKSDRYYYDAEAIKEPAKFSNEELYARIKENHKSIPDEKKNGIRQRKPAGWDTSRQGAHGAFHRDGRSPDIEYTTTHAIDRNKRSVWTVATQPYSGAHFATFPPQLIEPCVKAGSKKGDIILDPFTGSGTTMQVARRLERHSVGGDLSLSYLRECAIPRLQLNHDEFYNGKKASGIIEDLPLFSKMP